MAIFNNSNVGNLNVDWSDYVFLFAISQNTLRSILFGSFTPLHSALLHCAVPEANHRDASFWPRLELEYF